MESFWKYLGEDPSSASVADQIARSVQLPRKSELPMEETNRESPRRNRKNSSELRLLSSEVSFHSSEVSYPVSVENKKSPPRHLRFPQWRLEAILLKTATFATYIGVRIAFIIRTLSVLSSCVFTNEETEVSILVDRRLRSHPFRVCDRSLCPTP